MKTETKLTNDCKTCRDHLPDLLLDDSYAASHEALARHLRECSACSVELNGLRSVYALLDDFPAPEPSAFFDTRLQARIREAQASGPEGFWERMRSFFLFSTGRSLRPVAAGALALLLLAGGSGTFFQLHGTRSMPAAAAATSPAVNDLKVLDNNVQAEQQMGPLLDTSGSEDGDMLPAS